MVNEAIIEDKLVDSVFKILRTHVIQAAVVRPQINKHPTGVTEDH